MLALPMLLPQSDYWDDCRGRRVGQALLVLWVLVQVSEHLRPRLPTQQRDLRAGRHRDQPQQRQPDADHHPGEDPEHQRPRDRRDRDPEVEALDPGEPAHLGHIHHAHHDRLDDERGEHRLGEVGEERSQHKQSEQHGDARDDLQHQRRTGAGAA